MKAHKALLAGLAVSLLPLAANAQDYPGFYIGGFGGVDFMEQSKASDAGFTAKSDWDTGFGLGLSLGYDFGGPRIEIEGAWRHDDNDKVKLSGPGIPPGTNVNVDDADNYSGMVNLLYDIDLARLGFGVPITPYVGGGIGAAIVDMPYADDDVHFAYQGIAGIAFGGDMLGPNVKIGLEYRYFATTDVKVSFAGLSDEVANHHHDIFLSLRYKFGAPPPAPVAAPAPPPPPPPPPPAAPAVKNYIVFFDWDKSVLTSEAQSIIRAAAENAKRTGVTRVHATGYADRSGPEWYNQKLSERRAAAVKRELVRNGIPAGEIVTLGKGERDPLVPTPDGVREPQNRRVEIVLD